MIQPKKKPVVAAAAAVAPSPQTPYTAARSGKDTTVNGAEADGLAQALDRRVTEGFNLVHGRLDVIQEDVRENRRDIKELRKELWDGLREAAADRARLASKADLDRLGESAAADRRRDWRRKPPPTGRDWRPGPTSNGSAKVRPPIAGDWRNRPPLIAGDWRTSSTPRLPRFGPK